MTNKKYDHMNSPLVDIVIPTYQRNDLLPETLESVANQTYTNWHCWIAEDGHSAETEKCVRPFCQDKRFTYCPGKHFGFPAGPRNRAIEAGSGKYIALLDDDDCWLPSKIEKQVAFMESHPDVSMVGANGYRWPGDKKPDLNILTPYHKKIHAGEITLSRLLEGNCFIASAVLIRRQCQKQAGLFNEDLQPPIGEDYEMWLRLSAAGKLCFTSEPLMLFREEESNSYYNRQMSKKDKYNWKASILQHALHGFQGVKPFMAADRKGQYKLVERYQRRQAAGPGFFGLLRFFFRLKTNG